MGIRAVRYYNRTAPGLGIGYRTMLDVSDRFGRAMGFYLPGFVFVPLDPEELAASTAPNKFDPADYLQRIAAMKAAMTARGQKYDEHNVSEVERLLKGAIPKPLPPARVRTRARPMQAHSNVNLARPKMGVQTEVA